MKNWKQFKMKDVTVKSKFPNFISFDDKHCEYCNKKYRECYRDFFMRCRKTYMVVIKSIFTAITSFALVVVMYRIYHMTYLWWSCIIAGVVTAGIFSLVKLLLYVAFNLYNQKIVYHMYNRKKATFTKIQEKLRKEQKEKESVEQNKEKLENVDVFEAREIVEKLQTSLLHSQDDQEKQLEKDTLIKELQVSVSELKMEDFSNRDIKLLFKVYLPTFLEMTEKYNVKGLKSEINNTEYFNLQTEMTKKVKRIQADILESRQNELFIEMNALRQVITSQEGEDNEN